MGAWVGKLALKGATGGMTDWRYIDGGEFMHSEAEVKAARKD
jgi:branched-chain amino acid transport system substrate-binding protein